MANIEQIRSGPYGRYLDKLLEMMSTGENGTDAGSLVEWWAETGVYEYMQMKHREGFKGDLPKVLAELQRQANEAING